MTGGGDIATPVGPLNLSLMCAGRTLGHPDRIGVLPGGARVSQWRDIGGLDVDLLVTRYDTFVPGPREPGGECWGAEWRLHARSGPTTGITLGALLPVGVGGAGNGDEGIVMTEVVADGWCLAVAGLDDGWYDTQDHAGLLAPSWAGLFREWSPDRSFGGVQSVAQGILWQLPGLQQGEGAKAYSTVAWCRSGGERAEVWPFDAVDIGPKVVLQSAGVRVFEPSDRWARKATARDERRSRREGR